MLAGRPRIPRRLGRATSNPLASLSAAATRRVRLMTSATSFQEFFVQSALSNEVVFGRCKANRAFPVRWIHGVNTLLTIKRLVAKQLGTSPDAIDENVTVDKLGMDSFAVLELLFELEDVVGVAIPREALPREGTLAQLAAALDGMIATKAAAPK